MVDAGNGLGGQKWTISAAVAGDWAPEVSVVSIVTIVLFPS